MNCESKELNNEMKQVSPWINLYREYEALFHQDPDIKVTWEDETKTIKLYVDNNVKAEALAKLLPMSRVYGTVTVNIAVINSNGVGGKENLLRDAFSGNMAFEEIITGDNPMTSDTLFVVFKPDVIQYKNDNLFSFNGLRTTVYEDIARDIFEIPGVYFNTDEK